MSDFDVKLPAVIDGLGAIFRRAAHQSLKLEQYSSTLPPDPVRNVIAILNFTVDIGKNKNVVILRLAVLFDGWNGHNLNASVGYEKNRKGQRKLRLQSICVEFPSLSGLRRALRVVRGAQIKSKLCK